MRTVEIGTNEHTRVVCLDESADDGSSHHYMILDVESKNDPAFVDVYASVDFQNGPIKEHGVNGCHNEDLIAIVIDRLEHFQKGDFACEANAEALESLYLALDALRNRTNDRKERGVEGTKVL